jgi:hypothetical protein
MNAPDARRGGLEVWAPSVVPPIGVELSNEQALAVAFRHLAAIGFPENMAGHITWQLDGQTDMFVNPWGLWWQELTASDICVVDSDARVVRGRWDVTPAIHIHTELHRVRDDARVVIHNHPTTYAFSPRWAGCPNWSTKPVRCTSTTCVWSTPTTAKSTVPLAQQISRPASEAPT